MALIGVVNEYGYTIFDDEGKEIYHAGNCYLESITTVPTDDVTALSVETLMDFCEQEGKRTAAELDTEWFGADYEEE